MTECQVEPGPGEVVITKTKPSVSFATPLVSQLLAARVDTLVVVGLAPAGRSDR